MKLLSIVIPIFNVEKYLNKCIESVVNQTYQNLEIILVDDGSPDRCPEICDRWKEKDKRIRVIHKQNGGLSDARNQGISTAIGEYIAFVDSDDFIDSNMYEIMIEAAERTGADIATCGRFLYKGKVLGTKHTAPNEILLQPIDALKELLCGGLIEEAAWDKVYKKSFFDSVRVPVGQINEDLPIMPLVLEQAKKIVCTGKPFYYYRINEKGITHSQYGAEKRIIIEHIEAVSTYLSHKYPSLNREIRIFKGRYAYVMLFQFYQNRALLRQYPEDYAVYRNYLVQNWIPLIQSKVITGKQRVEIICMIFNVYTPVWNLIQKIKSFRSL